jgi:hypothetical protein
MKRLALAGTALAGLAAWPGGAGASGDFGCTPQWSLSPATYECAGSALIGPRNDTRMNMAFLLRDRTAAASRTDALRYPAWGWENSDFGHVFVSWDGLQSAYWPAPAATPAQAAAADAEEPSYAGSRCQTLASGGQAFRAALAAGKGLTPAEREALDKARDLVKPACDGDKTPAAWPSFAGTAAQGWLAYLQGARAFYADDFPTARSRFAGLTRVKEPWLAETARYMIARNELAAAQVGAFDEWGGYAGGDKVDRPSAERARAALQDYLSAYPRGLYAESASGLTRRAAWLLGDKAPLARTYAGLLAPPLQSPDLLEEVDNKVFFGTGLTGDADAPLLLATWDLLRMRQAGPDAYVSPTSPTALTAQELAGQAKVFAGQPDLYGFLRASFAYHVAKDYRRVLAEIPDDARARSFTPLAFSRQLLRGLALEALGDGNAAGFFQQLAGGARDLYQGPAVQLALALHWERAQDVSRVFAPASVVVEPEIRTILLARIASPDLLRRQAAAKDASAVEREVAVFTLLTKDLSRGAYAAFGSDLAQVPAKASASGWVGEGWSSSWMDPTHEGAPPLGLFTQGKWQESYPCPALSKTAATLATSPADPKARLCLAEFWRLNGFDDYLGARKTLSADELGGTADLFPGKPAPRAALYAAVLADRSVAADDTAYALYRSVQCYAPSGNNACGGKEVPKAQRGAWFQRLKRDYPKSRWATSLKYYW